MAFDPPLGSTSPAVLLDNATRFDELVNGPAGTVPDRAGQPLDTWRQMMAKNDEVRQNLIPLSKQYMTLAAAQADIANIPEGSTTYYRSPDESALAIEVMNVGGTLQPTGRKMPSQENIDSLIRNSDGINDIYLAFTDKNGLGGNAFFARGSDKSFGTEENRVSTTGLDTSALGIFIDTSRSEKLIITDVNGLGLAVGDNTGSGGGNGVDDSTISGSIKGGNELTDLWSFANSESLAIGKKSASVLSVTGAPAKWPNSITLKGGSSWLTLPFQESALYTVMVVFQLPYIAVGDVSTARGIIYSYDTPTTQGLRLHLQMSDAGIYSLYSFRYEEGFPFAGIVLPPDFKPGDWVCLHHVVSRNNTGDNHQCIFLGGRYTKWVEYDNTPNSLTTAQLNIGATTVNYTTGYNYAYCEMNIAECAYFNAALSETLLRNSFASIKNRMSNLGITLRSF